MKNNENEGEGAYELITPPNTLKAKVGPGAGIDPAVIQRAQSLVNSMSGEFEQRAAEEAVEILRLADVASKESDEDSVVEIFRIGHEMKGQGGTFGYPLISKIGGSLCRYIEAVANNATVDLDIVRSHGAAIRAVAINKVTGEGGALENELIGELNRLVKQAAN